MRSSGAEEQRLKREKAALWLSERDEKILLATIKLGRRALRTESRKMHYQPFLRPGFPVDPLPEPRVRVRRLMQATALAVEGLIDSRPGQSDQRLEHCLYMPQASVIVAGTGCRRPLLLREAADVSAASNLDVLVVRSDDSAALATFDLKKTAIGDMFCAYRMWMPRPSEAAWLIPSAGEDLFVRITPLGLEVYDRAPFADTAERHVGIVRGTEFLSVAVNGWF